MACITAVALGCNCTAIINKFDGKAQYYSHHYALQLVESGEYLGETTWVDNKKSAKKYLYYDAARIVDEYNQEHHCTDYYKIVPID